eukprot:1047776-Alexandrium_andersonii.AAC.1
MCIRDRVWRAGRLGDRLPGMPGSARGAGGLRRVRGFLNAQAPLLRSGQWSLFPHAHLDGAGG